MDSIEKNKLPQKMLFSSALILVIVFAGIYFYNIINWANYPNFGFGWRTSTGIDVVGTLSETGRDAGLSLGDRIITINGQTFTSIDEMRAVRNWGIGEINSYVIERDERRITIQVVNTRKGFKHSFTQSGFLFLLGLCYGFIGIIVFLMKPYNKNSWVFFIFTSVMGLYLAYLFKASKLNPPWLETVHMFTYIFTPAALIHLSFSFPEERRFLKNAPYIQLLPYIFSAILFGFTRSMGPTMRDAPRFLLNGTVIYLAGSLLYFLGSCIQLWIVSSSEIAKRRAKLILLGAAISTLVPLLDFITGTFIGIYVLPGFNYYLPFFIVFPLFVGYAIVKHDLFDIDAIIKRTYGYVLTTGALASIYGLVVLISNLAFGRYEITKSRLFPLIFILAVVFLFNPVRNRVQRFIDRVFYRLEYDYQETVGKISETMRSLLNLDEIGRNLMRFALQPMFVDAGSVMLLNPDTKAYDCLIKEGQRESQQSRAGDQAMDSKPDLEEEDDQVVSGTNGKAIDISDLKIPADDPLMQNIADQKKEVTIYDIQEDPFFEKDRESCLQAFERLGATLLVPLIYEDKLTGVISLGRKKSGKFYRREDINLLNILANQGAVAIENALMVEDVIEKERMEEELNIARDLQVSMLPTDTPQVEGFEIAAYSMAAREVGGDFYDFIDMGEKKAGMLIGDVTGKSVSGALVMSASRSVFRMLSEEERSVKDNMMRANRRIKKDVKTGMFVALLYAVLDSEDRSLVMCSAGQTQPVYLPAGTDEAILVETEGDTFPLGILDEAEYEETRLQLEPGDKVILYTDGIVEAMNDQEELFGFERLQKLVQSSQAPDAESLLKEILDKVNEFAGQAEQHDDLTTIVIKAV